MKRDRAAVALQVSTAATTVTIPAWVIAGAVWGGLALILAVLALWCALESATYFLREPQITPYVRSYIVHRPVIGFLGSLALIVVAVAAIVHFWLDR